MKNKDLLEEGFSIVEFSPEFFEEQMKDDGTAQYVQDIIQRIQGKQEKEKIQNGKDFQQKKTFPAWRAILSELMADLCPEGIVESFRIATDPDGVGQLYPLLVEFYSDPDLLCFDVAQTIIYNLYRLEEMSEFDMEKDGGELWKEEELDVFWEIGRKRLEKKETEEIGKKKRYNRDEKEMEIDFLPDLDRLAEKYKGKAKPAVYFTQFREGTKIRLEDGFRELEALYISNEKFQDFLHQFKVKDCCEMLEKNVKKLNEITGLPLHYIWEKMTYFNTINILAKFFLKYMEKENDVRTKKEAEIFIEWLCKDQKYLFRQIRSMPNVLTKLLLLKEAFAYIEKFSRYDIGKFLRELTLFLAQVNDKYLALQRELVRRAMLVRWNMSEKKQKTTWISELEEEYSADLFAIWLLSLNITDELVNVNLEKDCTLTALENKFVFRHGKQKIDPFEVMRKERLLEIIMKGKYCDTAKELAKILKDNGWLSTNPITYVGEVEKDGYIEGPTGPICTAVHGKDKVTGVKIDIDENRQAMELEKTMKEWLLSEYKNVMYENTYSQDDEKYKETLNFLLYHFFK